MVGTRKNRGFAFIELLVSLGIIIVAVTIATLVIDSIKIVRDAGYENSAFRIASTKLDELRAGGYDALTSSGPFTDPGLARLPQGSASTSIMDWNDKTKKVVAGVSWLTADGSTKVVSLTTLVTKTGGL